MKDVLGRESHISNRTSAVVELSVRVHFFAKNGKLVGLCGVHITNETLVLFRYNAGATIQKQIGLRLGVRDVGHGLVHDGVEMVTIVDVGRNTPCDEVIGVARLVRAPVSRRGR